MAREYNNQLEAIFSWSFPSNHLIQFSLNKEIRPTEQWPQSAKVAHFFFVTIVAGVKTNDNEFGKTYDFKNSSYTMKFSIEEIYGLSSALKYAAAGQLFNIFGGYTKFARSAGNMKQLYLMEMPPNDKNKIKGVGIGYSQQTPQVKMSPISLSADHTIAMSEILMKMAIRATELELDRMEKLPKNRGTGNGAPNNSFMDSQIERSGFESPVPQPPQGNNDPFSNITSDFANMLGGI